MGLLRMAARTAVVAGTATAVSGRVHHRQAARCADQDAQQYAEQPPQQPQYQQPPPAAPARTTPPHSSRIWRSFTRRACSPTEEFAAAKAKILGI